MAYTDNSQISNFLGRALTAYETSQTSTIIGAVKVWVDKILNSTFDVAVASIRYYDGGVRNLDIDPCTAITKVEALNDDGTGSFVYTAGTEYIAEPQNETVKRELRKRLSPFPRGIHRIAVSATFSEYDVTVPADIQLLTTRLVAGIINAGKYQGIGGILSQERLEGHEIQYDTGDANFLGLSKNDPTIASILEQRKELYVDDYDRRSESVSDGDYYGGLIL